MPGEPLKHDVPNGRLDSRRRRAFTIVEMLVVVSLIVLLIALLLPALGRARYHARVAMCLSNYHQWGAAMSAYANDWQGALPRQDIPQTTGVNTWDVSNEFVRQMHDFGLTEPMVWSCPTRPDEWSPDPFVTADDAVAWFSRSYGHFSIITHNLWVPRRFGSKYFPSLSADPLANPGEWPTSLTDPLASDRPVLTDRIGKQIAFGPGLNDAFGGHRNGRVIESTNHLFADGHAETRSADEIDLRYSGNWQNMY